MTSLTALLIISCASILPAFVVKSQSDKQPTSIDLRRCVSFSISASTCDSSPFNCFSLLVIADKSSISSDSCTSFSILLEMCSRCSFSGFAPIFPDTCYHLTHYWLAAVDIPVASDNPVHYADAIRYNARTPLQGSLLPLTRLVWA